MDAIAQRTLRVPRILWIELTSRHVRLRGMLAAYGHDADAHFAVRIAGREVHRQPRLSAKSLDLRLPAGIHSDVALLVEPECHRATSPLSLSDSKTRELGFAITESKTIS